MMEWRYKGTVSNPQPTSYCEPALIQATALKERGGGGGGGGE